MFLLTNVSKKGLCVAVDSRTSDVSIFMCSGGVRWILVMFDVMTHLLCWILIC
jgi:hypothetical protein